MSHVRLARLSLILAALGLNLAPALMNAAHAQSKAAEAASVAPPPEVVRPELFKILDPATFKDLMTNKKYAEVGEKLTQAAALPNLTPYETYIIDRMRVVYGSTTGNNEMAMKALEAVIATKRLPDADQANFIQVLGNIYYNAKNYPKAIEWMKFHQKTTGNPATVRPLLIRAYYVAGDYASAKQEIQLAMDAHAKAGETPTLEELQLWYSTAIKTKDDATYLMAMEKVVSFYPNDDYWTDLLHKVQNKPSFNLKLQLEALRLEFVALKVMAPEEYTELAELALHDAFPGEAKKALDAGFSAGVLGTGSNGAKHKKLRDQATKQAADDQKNIGAGEAQAIKSKDGTGLINLGYAYVTMDQYDKGIELMEKGVAKGGMKRPEEAKLRLGTAYARAGRKADAIKTLESVKGDDGLSDLAHYWIVWLNRKPVAPAAAPAAK
jgi:tetratricopeptide (TPR) repeat protein